jgi:predicted negative regulator of RcsB-dependent stress response
MAEDYLTDDEQWEAIKRGLKENGVWIVAGVAIGLGLFFGYQYYQSRMAGRDLQAGVQFDALTTALDGDDRAAAQRIAAGIVKDYGSTPYADQAELVLARIAVEAGKPADAVAALSRVMNSSKDKELQSVARLRLARVQIDMGKPDDAVATLAAADAGAFKGRYHEVRGDAYYVKKDLAGAAREYQAALEAGDARADDAVLQLKLADLGVPAAPRADKAKP